MTSSFYRGLLHGLTSRANYSMSIATWFVDLDDVVQRVYTRRKRHARLATEAFCNVDLDHERLTCRVDDEGTKSAFDPGPWLHAVATHCRAPRGYLMERGRQLRSLGVRKDPKLFCEHQCNSRCERPTVMDRTVRHGTSRKRFFERKNRIGRRWFNRLHRISPFTRLQNATSHAFN